MILEIGSGLQPMKADLHIDLAPYPGVQILGALPYLPFQDKVFDVVYSRHVLEHILNPVPALEDMKRIGRIVIVIVPNAKYRNLYETKGHFYSWNRETLKNLLETIFARVEVKTQYRFYYPLSRTQNKIQTFKLLLISLLSRSEKNQIEARAR